MAHKIIELNAENFKILKAVSIAPDGTLVEICGQNGQGKSSVLDVITSCLGGAGAVPLEPIRRGQKRAEIEIDLGELKVRRKFKEGESARGTLTVEFVDGSRPKSPQHVLDTLAGMMIDPVAFIRTDGAKRIHYVRSLVADYDWEEAARCRKEKYDDRTDVNRQAKRMAAQVKGWIGPEPERIDISSISERLKLAHATNAAHARDQMERQRMLRDSKNLDVESDALSDQADRMEREAKKCRESALAKCLEASKLLEQIERRPTAPLPIDVKPIEELFSRASETNRAADEFMANKDLREQIAKLESNSDALTKQIEAIDEAGKAALAAARLPVGEFGDDDLIVDGVHFTGLSQAQQIITAVQISMAGSPKIKVILIRDGSLLDKNSLSLVADLAKKNDYQVWVERVSEGPTPGGILIEDGEISK